LGHRELRETWPVDIVHRLCLAAQHGANVVLECVHDVISFDSAASARDASDLTVPGRQSSASAMSPSARSA
jgi:hypothetical protein